MERISHAYPDMWRDQRGPTTTPPPAAPRMQDPRREPEPCGILTVHASAASTDQGALIFLGPSGTGKSTICRLLEPAAQTLADDKVYLVPQEGSKWAVVDASTCSFLRPLPEPEIGLLEGPPLRAIIRLYQAPTTHLESMDQLETCRHLANAFFELHWQKDFDVATQKSIYKGLAEVIRTAPGYRLYFHRSCHVQTVINEEMNLR